MAHHLKHKREKWISPTRVVGMDHGTKTIGVAICNSDQTIVTPMDTIHRKKWKHDKVELDKVFTQNDIIQVLVGYPLNMDGSAGARCQSVKDFVTLMEETWPHITFFFFDERLSTQTVDKFLDNDMSKTRIKRKAFKDSLAAKVILDEALQWLYVKNIRNEKGL